MSSRIAGSSSTTRIDGIMGPPRSRLCGLGTNLLRRRMAHVLALDDLHDGFGDILGVVADAFDRFRDEYDFERRRNRARILHHVADELPQDRGERGVDRLVL